ncbi:NucA/NucB deoxyribonuclease domain-containing protein [Actinoallomurus sp. CA-150999]|uniref:NucA/NucB deoxyribonuclease domain-containing protein n=1 Tax=Actinoallomurus sp. CA-150999 TaxID=3239887 RepID=UPI003D8F0CCB
MAASASVDCPKESRTTACDEIYGSATLYHNGQVEGHARLKFTVGWHTRINSPHFRGELTVEVLSADFSGATATVTGGCGSPCFSTGSAHGAVIPGHSFEGTLEFDDVTNNVHTNLPSLTMQVHKPGYPGAPASGNLGTTVRCDDLFKGRSAGCVINAFNPTLKTMSGLPHIATHIRNIQTHGPSHYGMPGSGHPLHRLSGKSAITKNRRAVCGRKVTGPPPKPDLTCDEYPFASSHEGGTALPKTERGIAWVPGAEQSSQGGLISAFYQENRILDDGRDAFYVEV